MILLSEARAGLEKTYDEMEVAAAVGLEPSREQWKCWMACLRAALADYDRLTQEKERLSGIIRELAEAAKVPPHDFGLVRDAVIGDIRRADSYNALAEDYHALAAKFIGAEVALRALRGYARHEDGCLRYLHTLWIQHEGFTHCNHCGQPAEAHEGVNKVCPCTCGLATLLATTERKHEEDQSRVVSVPGSAHGDLPRQPTGDKSA